MVIDSSAKLVSYGSRSRIATNVSLVRPSVGFVDSGGPILIVFQVYELQLVGLLHPSHVS